MNDTEAPTTTDELCGAIMTPGRHWGPDLCVKQKDHIAEDPNDWHFGASGASWSEEACV